MIWTFMITPLVMEEVDTLSMSTIRMMKNELLLEVVGLNPAV